jgi:hypothetical protein
MEGRLNIVNLSWEEVVQAVSGNLSSDRLNMKLAGFLSASVFLQMLDKERLGRIAERMAEHVQTVEQWSRLIEALVA